METGLKGKKALITGGSSGIGFGIASVLAKEGVDLAIASRNPDEQALTALRACGVRCHKICADVSDEIQVISMVAEAIEKLGGLDLYVNNAAWTWHQPITRITDEAWQSTINTNLRSCVFACREVSKHMIQQRKGNIIIVGSTVNFFAAYTEASYRISKVGLRAFMETLAIEMAPYGIRVNMVVPGHFVTRMTAGIAEETLHRLHDITLCHRSGEPEELGNAVAFLASDMLSAFTYGGYLVVDGGLTLNPLKLRSSEEIEGLNL